MRIIAETGDQHYLLLRAQENLAMAREVDTDVATDLIRQAVCLLLIRLAKQNGQDTQGGSKGSEDTGRDREPPEAAELDGGEHAR